MFDIKPEDLQNLKYKKINDLIFKPDSGDYKIRFIPWFKDPRNSIVEKKLFWITNPETDKLMGYPFNNIVNDLYWQLMRKNKYKYSKYIKLQKKYFSIIQIIKDSTKKYNSGELFILNYNSLIYLQIKDQLKQNELVFHPYKGNIFNFSIDHNQKFTKYNNSYFLGNHHPILVNGDTCFDDEKIINFLKKNSPDLSLFEREEIASETHSKHLGDFIKVVLPEYNTKRVMNII